MKLSTRLRRLVTSHEIVTGRFSKSYNAYYGWPFDEDNDDDCIVDWGSDTASLWLYAYFIEEIYIINIYILE